jgi:hypothetical protein
MKLFYRGHSYETHEAPVQEQGTEEIGVYRGARLMRKNFRVPHEEHGKVELTYRGVKYSHEL